MTMSSFKRTSATDNGLFDPVLDAQSVFRAIMTALAEPGIVRLIDPAVLDRIAAPEPLTPSAAAILLTLADFETPVWLDAARSAPEIGAYLRFHAGCPLVDTPDKAAFALIGDATSLATLEGFATGSHDYPDRSTTLIIEVASLDHGPGWNLSGPGIADERLTRISSVSDGLLTSIQRNHARFPCGVDLLFTDGNSILALPRSTVVTEA